MSSCLRSFIILVVLVLHVVAADRWTGAAATALQAVEALQYSGVDAHLVFRPGRNLQQRLAPFPWAHPILEKERSPATLLRVLKALKQLVEQADVVHVHLPHDHFLARWVIGGMARKPRLVRSIHHPQHLRADLYQRMLLRTVAGIGVANSSMVAQAEKFAPKAPVVVLPLALEERFSPQKNREAIRTSLGIPANAFTAGTVGKLDPVRGQDLLLRALAAVPSAWGLIVGKGPYLGQLQKLAKKLGVAERVVFAGYHEDGLEKCYAAMDVFVFPEAGSDWAHRAIAEAAACAVPTLAVDIPGIHDLVEPGRTGELWTRGDAASLAVLLERWQRDESLRQKAGKEARQRAERFTHKNLAKALTALYAGEKLT